MKCFDGWESLPSCRFFANCALQPKADKSKVDDRFASTPTQLTVTPPIHLSLFLSLLQLSLSSFHLFTFTFTPANWAPGKCWCSKFCPLIGIPNSQSLLNFTFKLSFHISVSIPIFICPVFPPLEFPSIKTISLNFMTVELTDKITQHRQIPTVPL